MRKILLVAVTVIIFPFCAVSQPMAGASPLAQGGDSSAGADIAIIRARLVKSILPEDPAGIAYLHKRAEGYATALTSEGNWPDIDYTAKARSVWVTSDHLERVLEMAESARIDRNAGHADTALEGKIVLALKWWTDHDYVNPNWWWNEIGVPQLMGEIGNLMLQQLPPDELAKMVATMKRSDWHRWTGANLTWGVGIQVARGCMVNDAAAVAEAYTRMYEEIKIVSQPEEGIEQDDSFHQHGQQLYNGGYGLDYSNDVSRFISYSWGTRFQIPADKMTIFSSYLLDGQQWFIRGNLFDYAAIGREITRQVKTPTLADQAKGPISPAGLAYRMGHVLGMLAAEPTPRQKELQGFVARLEGKPDAPAFTGNKQFWESDYMAQRRKGYCTSVKMLSTRSLNSEFVNSEGKRSVHMSDGANYLYLTGEEYRNIFPVWDWTKIPGTTAIQGTLDTGERKTQAEPYPIHVRGTTTFDGGVSDGTYGMAAMDLVRGNLIARKAWFFFDDRYVALGAGITLGGGEEHDVATDVNQPLLQGAVKASEAAGDVGEGLHTYESSKRVWVYHDHVGYVFAPHTKINLSVGPQSGRWSDIGTGPDALVTEKVFDLWIDHGRAPQNGSYEYTVFPGAGASQMAELATSEEIDVLANTGDVQAVYNRSLELAEIAFRKAGVLKTPLGTVKADHSCLLLVRKEASGWKVTASNPENEPLALGVTVQGKVTTIQLPGGNWAGSSVSAETR